MAMEAVAGVGRDGRPARGNADEAGRGTGPRSTAWRLVDIAMDKAGAGFSYALDRRSCDRSDGGKDAICCGPTGRERPRAAVAVLYPTRCGGTGIQNLKGDLAIRPISIRKSANRSSHLHRSWLIIADHATASPARSGAGTDRAPCSREVRRRPDDRCSSANHRRARAAADPLHSARARTPASDPAAQAQFAAAAATAHRHRPATPSPAVVKPIQLTRDQQRAGIKTAPIREG